MVTNEGYDFDNVGVIVKHSGTESTTVRALLFPSEFMYCKTYIMLTEISIDLPLVSYT